MPTARPPTVALTERLDEAFAFARALHARQARKGSGVPYLTHLMSVAALVGEHGGSEDQMIAALLHDAVEDQGGQPVADEIRRRFGETVYRIVMACSDSVTDDPRRKDPWRPRKERYLRHLEEQLAGAAEEMALVRLVSAADKLHNARTILADLRQHGGVVWSRFQGGQEGSLWYYGELCRVLGQGWSSPLVAELARVVREILALADPARGHPPRPPTGGRARTGERRRL